MRSAEGASKIRRRLTSAADQAPRGGADVGVLVEHQSGQVRSCLSLWVRDVAHAAHIGELGPSYCTSQGSRQGAQR